MSRALPVLSECRDCPRLAKFLTAARKEHPDWVNEPVAAFGDPEARLLVVGLAPGLGGANRTGRPFTGDRSGEWLWSALQREGFANRDRGDSRGDGLVLTGAAVTNAVKCVPPGNKPTGGEIATCRRWLAADRAAFAQVRVVVALGKVAHDAWLALAGAKRAAFPFAHGAVHRLPDAPVLVDSFHPSPLNTQTGRMSKAAWRAVWKKAARLAREQWWVYVAKCGDGTLYAGITNDLARRRAQHAAGEGAKYTRGRGTITIVHAEPAATKSAALKREWAIKAMKREQKLALVSGRATSST